MFATLLTIYLISIVGVFKAFLRDKIPFLVDRVTPCLTSVVHNSISEQSPDLSVMTISVVDTKALAINFWTTQTDHVPYSANINSVFDIIMMPISSFHFGEFWTTEFESFPWSPIELCVLFLLVFVFTFGSLYIQSLHYTDKSSTCASGSAKAEDIFFGQASPAIAFDDTYWTEYANTFGIPKATMEDILRMTITTGKFSNPFDVYYPPELSSSSSSVPETSLASPTPLRIAVSTPFPISSSPSISIAASVSATLSATVLGGFLPPSLSTCSNLADGGRVFGMVLPVQPSFQFDLVIDDGSYLRSALNLFDDDAAEEAGFWPELDQYVASDEGGRPTAWYMDPDEMRGWMFPGREELPEFEFEEVAYGSLGKGIEEDTIEEVEEVEDDD